jgi:glycogen debranching enzyme
VHEAVTVLDGSTFAVCDELGDLDGAVMASGFFAADTRFLSRLVLTVDGDRVEPVSFEQAAPHVAVFALRGPAGLAIRRELFVGRGFEETITVENPSAFEVKAVIELELASDFADIHAVRRIAEQGGRAASPRPEHWTGAATVAFADDGFPAQTLVHLAPAPDEPERRVARYRLALAPGDRWELVIAVQSILNGSSALAAAALEHQLREDRRERDHSLRGWWGSVPRLRAPADPALEQTWTRSLADLAALRLRWTTGGMVPAAGLPWFMTLFGRDTLIAAFQTLPLGAEPAVATLRALAETQSDADDPERDAEPGKIVHEIRRGKTALVWADRYYGTIDATPLFLVLLSELWRWTGDEAIVRELEGAARRALAWIDGPADPDSDGFVEYLRRATHGLDNQNWKDSSNSMVFRDGSLARPPIAPVEAQGYVYDAKVRTAELARHVWRDEETAARLEDEASVLCERFDAAYWLPDHGWYALGLDAEKRQVDALGSNMGHLLWSGIVPAGRLDAVAKRLTSPPLFSGWGVRTLADDEAAFDPLEYHNGTVWPHDNSLIAFGLARAGRAEEARLVARAQLDSAPFFEHRLPELFAGYDRSAGEPPGVVPTSARPQAWAAGAPILLLRALLGLEPDPAARTLRVSSAAMPQWAEGLEIAGVHAFGARWTVRVEDGAATVGPASSLH